MKRKRKRKSGPMPRPELEKMLKEMGYPCLAEMERRWEELKKHYEKYDLNLIFPRKPLDGAGVKVLQKTKFPTIYPSEQ
jgi:hypothetical protein